MTTVHPKATLRHWRGPYYVRSREFLQTVYQRRAGAIDGRVLIEAAQKCAGFRHPCTETTDDGYRWERGLVFKVLRRGGLIAGQAIIMFPCATDGVLDRDIAMYGNGDVTEAECETLLQQFHERLCDTIAPDPVPQRAALMNDAAIV